ncbi:MAG: hypothetical protein H6868_01905 [Rhodospirillales bacterium]|nr:hypothetical protein [Rhodospirillales bacterium]
MFRKRLFSLVLPLAVFMALPGCTASFMDSGFSAEKVDITATNYAAADMLIQQSKSFVTPETPLQIGVLSDINDPNRMTALGRIVTGQIGARFVQLGYNVTAASFDGAIMPGMPTDMAGDMVSPTMGGAQQQGSPATITGHYAHGRKSVLINLRILETGTRRVLAAYDYSLPLNDDLEELMETPAMVSPGTGYR